METAIIKAYVHAPRERVWTALTDHEGLARYRGVRAARLLVEGAIDRNGLGARREVFLGPIRFVEDIVRFEAPSVMEYRVVACSLPFEHDIGRVVLVLRGAGTEVHWTTRFRLPLPLVGRPLGKLVRALVCDGFHGFLLEVKDALEAPAPA